MDSESLQVRGAVGQAALHRGADSLGFARAVAPAAAVEPARRWTTRHGAALADGWELSTDILRQGRHVKVLAPPELRAQVAQEFKVTLGQYADSCLVKAYLEFFTYSEFLQEF